VERINIISLRWKRAPPPIHPITSALLLKQLRILPVPPSLVEKIESGQFVEMGDLVPSHLGFEETAGFKSIQLTHYVILVAVGIHPV